MVGKVSSGFIRVVSILHLSEEKKKYKKKKIHNRVKNLMCYVGEH